jgi:N-acyl-L-homoserine lactone synthetase
MESGWRGGRLSATRSAGWSGWSRWAVATSRARRGAGGPRAQNYTLLWRMTSCMQSLKMSRISAIRRIVVK